jgi:hypothetical protein
MLGLVLRILSYKSELIAGIVPTREGEVGAHGLTIYSFKIWLSDPDRFSHNLYS